MRPHLPNQRFRLHGDERGNVAVMFALAVVPLIGLITATLEYGFMSREKARLQAASDAATVALGPLAASSTPDQLKVKAERIVRDFVGDNFAVEQPRISAGGTELTLVTRMNHRAKWLQLPGIGKNYKIEVLSRTIVTKTRYEIALVLDNSGSMASSAGGKSKMASAKDAAASLVKIMFGNPMSRDRTSISLVPFTLSVNVGKTYRGASWMDLKAKSSVHWQNTDFADSSWKPESKWKLFDELGVEWAGCVEHRPGDLGTSDDLPSAAAANDALFVPQFAPDEPGSAGANYTWREGNQTRTRTYPNSYIGDDPLTTCSAAPADGGDATLRVRQNRLCKYRNRPALALNSGRGPNYMCDAKPLTRLQKKDGQGKLDTEIGNMAAAGNTNLLEGFMWGWRTLSPHGPFAEGEPYDTKDNRKVIILMTDGMNAWNAQSNHNKSVYSPFGYYGQNRLPDLKNKSSTAAPNDAGQARDRMDAHTLKACDNARTRKIDVYTVGFSTATDPIDAKGLDLLKRCATNEGMAYTANSSEAIVQVFEEIARNIGGLRIAE